MANRYFQGDLRTPERGLIQLDMLISMQSGTSGVDATNTVLPSSFVSVARTGVGIVTLTLADPYVAVRSIGVTMGNSGAWLAAFSAQPSQALPYNVTTASTITIHVGNATVLADPGAAYTLHVTLLLKNTAANP